MISTKKLKPESKDKSNLRFFQQVTTEGGDHGWMGRYAQKFRQHQKYPVVFYVYGENLRLPP